MPGLEAFAQELRDLGFDVVQHGNFVIFDYPIDVGPLAGQTVKIGLDATGHPHSPPSGPFVSPRLLPMRPDATPAPLGGVHEAGGRGFPDSTGEWQYWSRPFTEWNQHGRSARAYIDVHLRRLFAQLPDDDGLQCAA